MIKSSRMISSTPTKRDSLLFVYGTLRPFVAIPVARWLAVSAQHLGTARTRGRLYDLGPYPGLVRPRRREDWVVGDLYRLQSPHAALRVLDRYEAGPRGRGLPRFVRVPAEVERGCRRSVAWLYLYRPPIFRPVRVRGGDYRRRLDGMPAARADV
jgi:gamma-glutamylcyclotransferase (GGCT)/AIG2-like uncharacterized protein YtfP